MIIMNENFQSKIYEFGLDIWLKAGVNLNTAHIFNSIALTIILFALLFVLDYILRRIVVFMVIKAVRRSKTKIDDYMIRNGVLKNVSHLIPWWTAYQAFPLILTGFPQWSSAMQKFTGILIIITFVALARSIAGTFKDTVRNKKSFSDKPLDSYFQ